MVEAMRFDWYQNGEHWGCDASDHGPFCRLCVRLDETETGKVIQFPTGLATPSDVLTASERAASAHLDGLAVVVVEAVWDDLMGRSGFGSALDDADDTMEDEIKNDLVRLVRRLL